MNKALARSVKAGDYVEFMGPADDVPLGFDMEKPYRVLQVHDNSVTPPRYDIFDRVGSRRTVSSEKLKTS